MKNSRYIVVAALYQKDFNSKNLHENVRCIEGEFLEDINVKEYDKCHLDELVKEYDLKLVDLEELRENIFKKMNVSNPYLPSLFLICCNIGILEIMFLKKDHPKRILTSLINIVKSTVGKRLSSFFNYIFDDIIK